MFGDISDLEGIKERVQEAKNKPYRMLERFHVGDIVYPFWLHNMIVYGTVIDIDTVAHKVICDFNGIRRQFCPEDLMLTNPELVKATRARNASVEPQNDLNLKCKECGGEIAVSYDEKKAASDFVCTQCGKRIPEEKLSEKTKKAMRNCIAKSVLASDASEVIKAIETIKQYAKKVKGFFHDCFELEISGGLSTENALDKLMEQYVRIATDNTERLKKEYAKKVKERKG